jgi:hypothetical protein
MILIGFPLIGVKLSSSSARAAAINLWSIHQYKNKEREGLQSEMICRIVGQKASGHN